MVHLLKREKKKDWVISNKRGLNVCWSHRHVHQSSTCALRGRPSVVKYNWHLSTPGGIWKVRTVFPPSRRCKGMSGTNSKGATPNLVSAEDDLDGDWTRKATAPDMNEAKIHIPNKSRESFILLASLGFLEKRAIGRWSVEGSEIVWMIVSGLRRFKTLLVVYKAQC